MQDGIATVVEAGASQLTTDHREIRRWMEARGGSPAVVRQSDSAEDRGLRVEFSGYRSGEWLESVSWETFFQDFEAAHLAFLYQESMSDGTISRFCQFVSRY